MSNIQPFMYKCMHPFQTWWNHLWAMKRIFDLFWTIFSPQNLVCCMNVKISNRVGCQRSEKRSKTHKRLKECFLIRWNRTKCANFRGKPLFQATYNNRKHLNQLILCPFDVRGWQGEKHVLPWSCVYGCFVGWNKLARELLSWSVGHNHIKGVITAIAVGRPPVTNYKGFLQWWGYVLSQTLCWGSTDLGIRTPKPSAVTDSVPCHFSACTNHAKQLTKMFCN